MSGCFRGESRASQKTELRGLNSKVARIGKVLGAVAKISPTPFTSSLERCGADDELRDEEELSMSLSAADG